MKKRVDFIPNERLRLIGFGETDPVYRNKLLMLGITRGTEIRIVRFAPLGCPIQIEVRGVLLGLRKADLSQLQWENA